MKVYCVFFNVDYEGSDLEEIFTTRDSAVKFVEEEIKTVRSGDKYIKDEFYDRWSAKYGIHYCIEEREVLE